MTAVSYNDLELAYGFVSSAACGEPRAYLSLDTGRIYWIPDDGAVEEDEDVPEDFETSERYVLVPHQHDLDLGRQLALDFADRELPNRDDEIAACFHRRGAYGRFKTILLRAGYLETWYGFEADAKPRRSCASGARKTRSK